MSITWNLYSLHPFLTFPCISCQALVYPVFYLQCSARSWTAKAQWFPKKPKRSWSLSELCEHFLWLCVHFLTSLTLLRSLLASETSALLLTFKLGNECISHRDSKSHFWCQQNSHDPVQVCKALRWHHNKVLPIAFFRKWKIVQAQSVANFRPKELNWGDKTQEPALDKGTGFGHPCKGHTVHVMN